MLRLSFGIEISRPTFIEENLLFSVLESQDIRCELIGNNNEVLRSCNPAVISLWYDRHGGTILSTDKNYCKQFHFGSDNAISDTLKQIKNDTIPVVVIGSNAELNKAINRHMDVIEYENKKVTAINLPEEFLSAICLHNDCTQYFAEEKKPEQPKSNPKPQSESSLIKDDEYEQVMAAARACGVEEEFKKAMGI